MSKGFLRQYFPTSITMSKNEGLKEGQKEKNKLDIYLDISISLSPQTPKTRPHTITDHQLRLLAFKPAQLNPEHMRISLKDIMKQDRATSVCYKHRGE